MKSTVCALFICFAASIAVSHAVLGIDMSGSDCNGMTPATWSCLYNNGYRFAIIQAWQGGYGYTSKIATCVADAHNAGFKYVDVYAFMCPNCPGTSAADQVYSLVTNLRNQGVAFGMLWFDVEQCSGCWNDAGSNCNFVAEAVQQAATMGVKIGLYSSDYEWGATVGGGCTNFRNYPLWYAHYDGVPAFSDAWAFQFGGWSTPAIKQFNDHGPCTDVDVNWYP